MTLVSPGEPFITGWMETLCWQKKATNLQRLWAILPLPPEVSMVVSLIHDKIAGVRLLVPFIEANSIGVVIDVIPVAIGENEDRFPKTRHFVSILDTSITSIWLLSSRSRGVMFKSKSSRDNTPINLPSRDSTSSFYYSCMRLI